MKHKLTVYHVFELYNLVKQISTYLYMPFRDSHTWPLRDDVTRLEEQTSRLSRCPLGSGAIAGCALPIDRVRLARDLGFDGITPNSMFAVGSRDHIGKITTLY